MDFRGFFAAKGWKTDPGRATWDCPGTGRGDGTPVPDATVLRGTDRRGLPGMLEAPRPRGRGGGGDRDTEQHPSACRGVAACPGDSPAMNVVVWARVSSREQA